MRISGIASGFDTDAMVKSMMAAERMKVDRFEKSKQLALWKQESYNTMNKAFANFILNTQKDMGLKKTGSTGTITNSSYKNVDYVKKATSSNEAAATVTSTGKAVNGSYKIDIEQLAEGASYSSGDMKDKNFGGSLEFNLNGYQLKIPASDIAKGVTPEDIVKAINNSKGKTLDGKPVSSDGTYFIKPDGTKGNELSDDDKKKLEGIRETSLGISAFYDKANGRLFMQTKETGEKAKINIDYSGDNVEFKKAFFNDENKSKVAVEGKDAKVKFNGGDLTYSSNKFNLNGLDIELKGTTSIKNEAGVVTSTNPISINVSTNTEGIMEKIEKLVKDYNDLVDLASLSVNEKAYPGYQPLTAEERKAMSESDVKLWDEKAKSGLLNRDETIQRTLQSIRNDLYKTVDGLEGFNHITQIGITTEKYSRGSSGGKLTIDTDKLKAAIEENPDAVMDLLFKEGPKKPTEPTISSFKDAEGILTPEKEIEYNNAVTKYTEDLKGYNDIAKSGNMTHHGIFTNIYENLITGMQAIIDKSGPGQDSDLLRGVKSNILIDFVTKKSSISDLDKTVQEMNRKMDNLNILLAKKEDSYYAKFTAMEKAMHKMNGQSGWLAQQFG
jgi:flagellar hook-associated protein 2